MTKNQYIELFFVMGLLGISYFLKVYGLNLNEAMYLQAAQLILQGQKPYIDLIDINPPLILYLNLIPAAIGRMFVYPGEMIVIFKLLLLAYIAGALVCVTISFRQVTASLKLLLFPLCVSFILFCIYLIQHRVFGEREQLFIIAFFPYLVLRYLRYSENPAVSRTLAFCIGTASGLLACLKPHFLFAVFIFELSLLFFFGRRKPKFSFEFLVTFTVPFLYLLHFLFLPDDIFHAFWLENVPLVLNNYKTFEKDFATLLYLDPVVLLTTFAICIGSFFLRGPDFLIRFLRILAVLGFVFLLHYFQQAKGWNYHLIPIYFILFLFIGLFVSQRKFIIKNMSYYFSLVLMAGLIVTFFYNTVRAVRLYYMPASSSYFVATASRLYEVVRDHSSAGDPIAIISSTNVYSYPLMLQMNRIPGSRYLFHFPLSFFAHHPSHPFSLEYIRRLKEDFRNRQPSLVIFVLDKPVNNALPDGFNVYEFLNNGGLFEADIVSDYEKIHSDSEIVVFKRRRE